MSRLIKTFPDGSVLEYDQGRFDHWCIYLTRPNKHRYAPRDVEYFTKLQVLSQKHGNERIYRDFVTIYQRTTKQLRSDVLHYITTLSHPYGEDALEIDIIFTIIYAGMVAEENKKNTRLGKRIKRLGVYQTLMEQLPPEMAANFSRGRPWRELDEECRRRGI